MISAALASVFVKRWAYTRKVIAAEAWPRRRLIVSMSMPGAARAACSQCLAYPLRGRISE